MCYLIIKTKFKFRNLRILSIVRSILKRFTLLLSRRFKKRFAFLLTVTTPKYLSALYYAEDSHVLVASAFHLFSKYIRVILLNECHYKSWQFDSNRRGRD
jgi:hypothetical protein